MIWSLAALACLGGAACGAAQHETGYLAVSIAYLVAAPLAAGLVRRGRALRMLVLSLPLALLAGLLLASGQHLQDGHFPLTPKGIAESVGQELVLHPGALWLGTLLALAVGLRRGIVHARHG